MSKINRRQFTSGASATVGALVLGPPAAGKEPARLKLPTVRWGKHEISRVLLGNNPLKGGSHFSEELNREMREFFNDEGAHARELLRRCQQCGINTCQMGDTRMEELLRAHYGEGGSLKWIATFYSPPGKGKEELKRILQMDPKPIGAQHFGVTTDQLMRAGKVEKALDTIKMLQDAGLLAGLGTHNWEVVDYVENKGWNIDFYQASFYRSTCSLKPRYGGEVFEEEDRQAMAKTLGQVSKPCIAYKVLGANRLCKTPADVEAAIRFAFGKLKPTDVLLLGMWQKYKDQVGENVGCVHKALGVS